jgi:hypothetical protein
MTDDVAIVVTNGLTMTLTLAFVATKARYDVLNRQPTP